ncbi:MAG: phosphoribosylglycinamide formyltransferase [Syntrophobacterales bacterium]|jgi:phosphoribosylglycinamide formyltransferase-1|nr:phosphoribosylglycinamide formyltransferase [Syntrophobacterales bacterium]
MEKKLSLGVLVSGSGSNLQSIIDHIEQDRLNAAIAVVISNNPHAYALTRAEKHHIPTAVITHETFSSREEFDRAIADTLDAYAVDLAVMAGFMRILSPHILNRFPQRIMNIHPALLPSFPGLHGQRQALEYGARFSGCTVHFVDAGIDSGPIIIQAVVPVLETDTEDTLSARILREEHRIYPQAIQWYAEGRIQVHNRQVKIIAGGIPDTDGHHNPPLTMTSL